MKSILLEPRSGKLEPVSRVQVSPTESNEINAIELTVRAVFSRHNYPYVGLYGELGMGSMWRDLRDDLYRFQIRQRALYTQPLSFIAVFRGRMEFSAQQFERCLWRELSFLTYIDEAPCELREHPIFTGEINIALFGETFSVLALRPGQTYKTMRFAYPVLIFSLGPQTECGFGQNKNIQ